jgi:two-component system chemotaxis sensor kinase CheA
MSDFNLADLLPFYLDETDEHISVLNDSLLRLEEDPADVKALQEAFRMFHSIKGASVVMGFTPVNQLNHHLETLFDQLRSKKRQLDRTTLDLTFRCLDELRDYHRDLRAQGQSTVNLSGLIGQVIDYLHLTAPTVASGDRGTAVTQLSIPSTPTGTSTERAELSPNPLYERLELATGTTLVIIFEPSLPLVDMKARLVLNRLSTKAQILSTDPPIERLDEFDNLSQLTISLTTEVGTDELRGLADVEGVTEIRVEQSVPPQPISHPQAKPDTVSTHRPKEVDESGVSYSRPPAQTIQAKESASARHQPFSSTIHITRGTQDRASSDVKPTPAPKKTKVAETIRVESDRLDYLMNLAGELVITKARFVAIVRNLEELFRGSSASTLTSDTRDRLESIARQLEGHTETKVASPGNSPDRWSVHIRKLRDNFRLVQDELDSIRQAREQLKSLAETIHSLGRVSDGLQKGVLDTRMVPIGPLFERFRRVIRDLSLSADKEVILQISGEKTELDKRMIDELSDPLIHMVRNAVDHGLESPNEREALHKPRAGTVSLQASHRGNSIVITVSDDGHGINYERIREKISIKGLVSRPEACAMTDRELITYIWHPGLSTAETITEISGRGVGMDIVKSRIENLSGTIDVRSVTGQGTTFTIRLPLTLAIMSSLLVRIYEEVYAIPLDHIDEIVEIQSNQVYHVQGQPTIEIRKKIIALIALSDVFRWGGKEHPAARNCTRQPKKTPCATEQPPNKHTVVIVQNGEITIGLLVDQLIGMQEVVLKSLERHFRTIPGLSGASILGDGRVSLILDLDAVLDLIAHQPPCCELR